MVRHYHRKGAFINIIIMQLEKTVVLRILKMKFNLCFVTTCRLPGEMSVKNPKVANAVNFVQLYHLSASERIVFGLTIYHQCKFVVTIVIIAEETISLSMIEQVGENEQICKLETRKWGKETMELFSHAQCFSLRVEFQTIFFIEETKLGSG